MGIHQQGSSHSVNAIQEIAASNWPIIGVIGISIPVIPGLIVVQQPPPPGDPRVKATALLALLTGLLMGAAGLWVAAKG